MNQNEEAPQGEIIIVRRSGHHEDEHHGGVWKIAFADFMTAMMAFFLVMWLINASNEKTKKAVASYFNPIKLTDQTTNSKGIKNPKYGAENPEKKTTEDVVTISTPAKMEIKLQTKVQKFDEQALFVDPYAILAEIERGVGQDEGSDKKLNLTEAGDGSSLNKGIAFQDPFDPNSWDANREAAAQKAAIKQSAEESFDAEQTNGLDGTGQGLMKSAEDNAFEQVDIADLAPEKVTKETSEEADIKMQETAAAKSDLTKEEMLVAESDADGGDSGAEIDADGMKVAGLADQEEAPGEALAGVDDGEVSEKLTEAASQLREKLEAALTNSNLKGLDVEVVSNGEGIVVVLSDNNTNGMFTIGSARPTSILVKTMAKLGGLVAEQKGKVEISGHTDGRKYQSKDYDNWRLSTARAHMAYYMLVRGGMEEERVQKITGQADVNLKVPDDPNSAANRRIEIVIKPS